MSVSNSRAELCVWYFILRSLPCLHAHISSRAHTCNYSLLVHRKRQPSKGLTKRVNMHSTHQQHARTSKHLQPTHCYVTVPSLLVFFSLLILHCHPNTLLRPLVAQPAKGTQTGKLPAILQDHDYILRVIIAAVCVEPTTRRYLYCMRAGGHWILQIHERAGICVL